MAKTVTKPVAKKAAPKKTVEPESPYIVTETIQRIAWEKIPNLTYIKCTLDGAKLTGLLVKEDRTVYILHDNPRRKGDGPSSRRGFKYSWCIGSDPQRSVYKVTDVSFPPMPEELKARVPIVLARIDGYPVEVYKTHVMVGCTMVNKIRIEEILAAMNSFK